MLGALLVAVVLQTSGTVVADTLWSPSLGVHKQAIVYLPPSYSTRPDERYPVVFYLHGLDGDETNWTRLGGLPRAMDSLVAAGGTEMIVVMPDGDDGWYTTWNTLPDAVACRRDRPPEVEPAESYCVSWTRYDEYVARDLVSWVDSTFRTRPDPDHRGIAGLSMGGYGAVSLALAYPDVFSAAASHSGVLSPLNRGDSAGTAGDLPGIAELRERWRGMWPRIEPVFGADTAAWWARDPGRLAMQLWERAPQSMPHLFLDAGMDDRLIGQSRDFHSTLERLGIQHHYAEWPGAHDWPYWRAHVAESLRWMGERLRLTAATGCPPPEPPDQSRARH